MSKKKNEVIIPEQFLQNPLCTQFPSCGGCSFQNASYEWELQHKENMVLSLLNQDNTGFNEKDYLGIVPAPDILQYRNKMEFTFGDEEKGGKLLLGMRKKSSYYEVCDGSKCLICDEDYQIITSEICNFFISETNETFYHKSRRTGALRNIVIRKAFFTGEFIINIITASTISTQLQPLTERLINLKYKGVLTGILHTICDSVADVVKADSMHVLHGQSFITEKLLGLQFKISPFSFFQTNSKGTELLYKTVLEFAGDTQEKIIYDLYCGTGTITQILAKNAKQAVGVEIVEEAVEAARNNAELNKLNNCLFIANDVLKVLDSLANKPDLIVLDPPREGIHHKALEKIVRLDAPQIIYVSCKPSSLVRDLLVFSENGYIINKVRCHDMFPRTNHVETVCLLTKTLENA